MLARLIAHALPPSGRTAVEWIRPRTSTVAYLVPVVALLYGVALLDEPITVRALCGLALILIGVAGVSGAFGLTARPRKAHLDR